MAARIGVRALSHARTERATPSADWTGWCLRFTRLCYGLPAVHPSAILAWRATDPSHRHLAGTPPLGVPVFWSGGPHGHVAVSAGKGYCYSTDIRRWGKVDKVRIELIHQRWGLTYLGWTETLNGYRVYTPPPPVSVAAVLTHVKEHGAYPQPVARALAREACPADVRGYARWQRRLGYRGRDADGYAGITTLTKLGEAHGFEVVP